MTRKTLAMYKMMEETIPMRRWIMLFVTRKRFAILALTLSVFGIGQTTLSGQESVRRWAEKKLAQNSSKPTTSTPLLRALLEIEKISNARAADANRFIGYYESLVAAGKTLAKANPSPETIDTIGSIRASLASIGDGSLKKWQTADRHCLYLQDLVLPDLKKLAKCLGAAMTAFERSTADKTAPIDIQTAYLGCTDRLQEAIKTVEKYKLADIDTLARRSAVVIAKKVNEISAAAHEQFVAPDPKPAAAATSPGTFAALIKSSVQGLGYAARSKEIEDSISADVIRALKKSDPSTPDISPDSKSLIKCAQQFIVDVADAAKGVATDFATRATNGKDELSKLLNDPRQESIDAHAMALSFRDIVKKETECQASIGNFVDRLSAKPLATLIPSEAEKPAAKALVELSEIANALNLSVSRLSVIVSALGLDYQDNIGAWTEDEINLYYFDDVERLMAMITPNVEKKRNDSAAQTYRQSQIDLLRAQEELVNSHTRLNDSRRQLANALEDLRLEQARVDREKERLSADAKSAGKQSDAQSDEVIKAQHDVDDSQVVANDSARAVTRAQEVLTNNQDPTKKAALQQALDDAKKKHDDDQTQLEYRQNALKEAKARQQAADTKTDTANSNLKALQDNVATLQQKVTAAQQDDATKNDALRVASTNAYVNAFIANRKFAEAVDSAPFFVTKRDGFADRLKNSTDPVERVILYGEPMEKRIIIRGRKDDVETVRRLISLLDRPQAQSEISVFTAEMSSATGNAQSERVQTALRVLNTELARYSLYNDTAQRLLRKAISATVGQQGVSEDALRRAIRRLSCPQAEFKEQKVTLTVEEEDTFKWLQKQDPKIGITLVCLDERVLRTLNISDAIRYRTSPYIAELPDLTAPASLAEASLSLALLKPELRNQVLLAYYRQIDFEYQDIVPEEGIASSFSAQLNHPDTFRPNSFFKIYKNFDFSTTAPATGWYSAKVQNELNEKKAKREVNTGSKDPEQVKKIIEKIKHENFGQKGAPLGLNSSGGGTPNDPDIDLLQDAYCYVFLASYRTRATFGAQALQSAIEAKWKSIAELEGSSDFTVNPVKQGTYATLQLDAEQLCRTFVMLIGTTLVGLNRPMDLSDQSDLLKYPVKVENREAWSKIAKKYTAILEELVKRVDVRSDQYHKLVARYNGALRRIMTRYYMDVQTLLVNSDCGLLVNVSKILRKSNSEVGAWTSETILASNRLAARLDPQASASAQQSSPIDALGGALVISNLITSGASQNIPQIFNGIKDIGGQQRNDAPAIYGLGSGNVFEVTPIVDPTGQAMRFRFNYLASTRVREPSGVSDRQLNHIEQSSVNTEVVLDNLAIKRVSTFQSNLQLGLPSQKSGGLPILKDLPFFKEIPILGWFTYRIGGRRPVVQQSIILTQVAIYPTIEDVVGTLSTAYKQHARGN